MFCAHLRCQACVQDYEGEDERVQQTGSQVLRQHVCEMEEAGAHGTQGELLFLSPCQLLAISSASTAVDPYTWLGVKIIVF